MLTIYFTDVKRTLAGVCATLRIEIRNNDCFCSYGFVIVFCFLEPVKDIEMMDIDVGNVMVLGYL